MEIAVWPVIASSVLKVFGIDGVEPAWLFFDESLNYFRLSVYHKSMKSIWSSIPGTIIGGS